MTFRAAPLDAPRQRDEVGRASQQQPQARHQAAPAASGAVQERLDEGVDWSKIAAVGNAAPLAVAAYDR